MLTLACLLVFQPIIDLLTGGASALSQGDTAGFMAIFDQAMPGRQELEANVNGLRDAYDVISSIEFVADDGSDTRRTLELDWFLELRQRSTGAGTLERRRQTLRCTVERKGRKWRVIELAPVSFFSPTQPPSGR